MRNLAAGVFLLSLLTSALDGQVTAAAAHPRGPNFRLFSPDGTIHYALTFSEAIELGSLAPTGTAYLTTVSGDVSYSNPSPTKPFSMLYAGGWRGSSQNGQPSTTFHNLGLSQGLIWGKWNASLSNSLSYLPQTPSAGLTGLPGLGDIGIQTPEGSLPSSPGFLSNYGEALNDNLVGGLSRAVGSGMSLNGAATWGKVYFLDGTGINTVSLGLSLGLNRRLSSRSGVGANYAYSRFSYGGLGYSFTSNGTNFLAHHQWTRTVSTSGSVGPQWITSSVSTFPASVSLAATANIAYSRPFRSAQLSYSRGSTGGSGVIPGAFSNSISASAQQTFRRDWAFAAVGTYMTASALGLPTTTMSSAANAGTGSARTISVQAARAFGRSTSAYVSYSAQFQSLNNSLAGRNALSGLSHTIGLGVTFSPQSKHLGQL